MARKKESVKRKASESESDAEFGIYNVERIASKKTDSKVQFNQYHFLILHNFIGKGLLLDQMGRISF